MKSSLRQKVGYDFVHHGEARGRGQREIPQDFSPDAVTRATRAGVTLVKGFERFNGLTF